MHPDLDQMLERFRLAVPDDVVAIRAALRAGTCAVPSWTPGYARGSELLHTYRIRAAHAAQFETEHARALRRDAEHLCEKVSAAGDARCRIWDFELEHGRRVHFIENADTGELLSVLHVVDRTKVTPEEWAALWGTAVEDERAWRRQVASMVKSADDKDEAF